ncbi:MAG: ABC transporter permease [Rubrivivax sp.]|nr:ABC transporter permease [Rubrivivax sp.]
MRVLWPLVWRQWRHQAWRQAVVVLAVALGVALAWSVHVINQSALAEFSSAVRSANGEPDLVLRGAAGPFDDALHARVAGSEAVQLASPVLEIDTHARRPGAAAAAPASAGLASLGAGSADRTPLRLLGVDGLVVAALAPDLMPRPASSNDRYGLFDERAVYLNAPARRQLGVTDGDEVLLRRGAQWIPLRVAGSVAAAGTPMAVMDIAAAQTAFGLEGRLSRIDLRLVPGADAAALQAALPGNVRVARADDAGERASALSRAYRVNLTVLALVALLVGGFLVFSVVSLSVAQRTPALALLSVLGLTARERRAWVLQENAVLGAAGSVLGLLLGTGLAWAALQWLAGDLGGGYFPGLVPTLQLSPVAAMAFFALGVASAVAGAWVPARHAEALPPAQALKGLGVGDLPPLRARWPLVMLLGSLLLALAPPVGGLPLAAYASVALLLFGGVALVPVAVQALLAGHPTPHGAAALLAVRRADHQRHAATAAVAGVVASLALSVALTVMVASFRSGVASWLDQVLPADLYARTAGSGAAAEQPWLDDATVARAAALPGVVRLRATRVRQLVLAPDLPAVGLMTRPLAGVDASAVLPLVGPALPAATLRPDEVGVYVSEAMVSLHGAAPGRTIELPLGGPRGVQPVRVLGVFRDYARQFGTVAIDDGDHRRLTGDRLHNELAFWLAPGTDVAAVQRGLRELLPDPSLVDYASAAELRSLSLRIFDRSFAVTTYLQVVAVTIGLVGVAASLSAQVLARRKEFGLLAHLGLRRREVLGLVAGETAVWMAAGTGVGLLLGLAVSVVLVHVVNPQSFHWTMALVLPPWRLAALCAAVLAAGVATAALSARGATARSAVLAVKEDW